MKRSILFLFLALALLFCACSCREPSVPPEPTIEPTSEPTAAPTPEPTPEPTAVPAMPYASAVLGDEPNDESYAIAVSLYETGANDFDGERAWTVLFDGLTPHTVDRRANPTRFSDDLSVWTTYDRDGDWDNCSLGRCIGDEAEWNALDALLFSREYEADPNAVFYIQTPRFTVRKGDLCRSSTSVWDVVGTTYYIDDDVCTYWINPDGTAIRADADDSVYRSVRALTPEQVAYLYLLYEAYYMAPAIQYPWPAHPEEMDSFHLLIERNGARVELPRESFEGFLALVSVPEDQTAQTYAPCFACVTELLVDADDPAPEVLRFRFVREGYDPDQSPYQWFSLRGDGRIVRETPIGAGYIHTVARWRCFGRNRIVSVAAFPVEDILAFLAPYGIE